MQFSFICHYSKDDSRTCMDLKAADVSARLRMMAVRRAVRCAVGCFVGRLVRSLIGSILIGTRIVGFAVLVCCILAVIFQIVTVRAFVFTVFCHVSLPPKHLLHP